MPGAENPDRPASESTVGDPPSESECCSSPGGCEDGMGRRDFLKLGGVGLASLSVLGGAAGCATSGGYRPDSVRPMPEEKKLDPKWVRRLFLRGQRAPYEGEALETIGMPCGGVAAGQLYVRGDGTLAHWWIANNAYNTGPGFYDAISTPMGRYEQGYNTFRPYSPIEQGCALRIEPEGEPAMVRELSREGFDDIRFFGEYPVATIEYGAGDAPTWPVETEARVFSPFIPLNARDSAMPVTMLQYTVKNTGNAPVETTVASWLQNPVYMGHEGRVPAERRNTVIREDEFTAISMEAVASDGPLPERRVEVFEDFESETFENWTVEGTGFGEGPVRNVPSGLEGEMTGIEGERFATSLHGGAEGTGRLTSEAFTISMPYLAFRAEGFQVPGKTDIELVVDGEVVRHSVGYMRGHLETRFWSVGDLVGETARLRIVDDQAEPWRVGELRHVSIDEIYFTNKPPLPEESFSTEHSQYGTATLTALNEGATATAAWEEGKEGFLKNLQERGALQGPEQDTHAIGAERCGAVEQTVRLQPGEKKTMTFLVSWHFPNRRQFKFDGIGQFGRPASTVDPRVGNMYSNWFDDALDVVRYVAGHRERLVEETFRFRDAYFDTTLPYWFIQRIGMPLANLATETCQWWGNGRFWGWEGVGCCYGTCNHVWNYEQGLARVFPEMERSIREMQDLDPQEALYDDGGVAHRGRVTNGAMTDPVLDGQAGTVLKVYREHLLSPDDAFLDRNWRKVKKVLDWLVGQDADADGMIEGLQPNTYDISFFGENTFVGSLYLAALRAGEEMALRQGEERYARRLQALFEQGRRWTVEHLWNGEYFIQDVDMQEHPRNQYGEGCLSDQLFGQNWAHQLGLGYAYPEDHVRRALSSVWTYNWVPDVEARYETYPPERVYARDEDAGLFICTWPRSEYPGEQALRYKNEVWTGIEYQVASHLLYEGMVEEGLAIVRGVHERYDGTKHNPWNEIECGDHYIRALASWGCLTGIAGFEYDGPAGKIGFAPRHTPEDFQAFFTAAEGWGHLHQRREDRQQTNRIAVQWGAVEARTLAFTLPEGARLAETTVETTTGGAVPAQSEQTGRRVTVELEAPAVLEKDDAIEATLSWV